MPLALILAPRRRSMVSSNPITMVPTAANVLTSKSSNIWLSVKLDKRASTILVYRYVDDLTQEEIAEAMKLSRKTVGKHLKKISLVAKKMSNSKKGGRP